MKATVAPGKIYKPTALSWYLSSEHLILAIGNVTGNVTLWNIEVLFVSVSLSPLPPNNNTLLRKLCFLENDILFVIKF